ncbi:ATP-binding protein [Streptomyces daliensis]|uniref:ATP-binding protein n=1 Tax=Streptomyces daliensis TaxID=299421 RepID=A0A8T4IUF4_9ACTN|nr:ATP-binding protein [Streptomyces daliensis]
MTATEPNETGSPGYSQPMPCEPESARRARALVDTALTLWRLADLVDVGKLVVSELVGNAVRHSRGAHMRVSVSLPTPRRVRIAVTDRSTASPAPRKPAGEEETGRGLLLVAALTDRWEVEYRDQGKTVWAELLADEGS